MEGDPKVEKVVILLDDSNDGDTDCEKTKGKCIQRPETRDQKAVHVHKSLAQEYAELADLNGFPNLAAMLAPRRSKKKRNRRNKNKITQSQYQPQPRPQIQTVYTVKDEEGPDVGATLEPESALETENIMPKKLFVKIAKEEKAEPSEDAKNMISLKTKSIKTTDNIVLMKLLRGPRYFDHPESKWGTCFKCGEDDHTAVNCMVKKQKKPCFICGGLDHRPKNCKQKKDCLICSGRGHRAKDCTEKHSVNDPSSKTCLRCGDLGHDLFSCDNNYSPDDLKKIQCYVCKDFGHLCCANFIEDVPSQVSCYNCGQSGHLGSGCTKLDRKACGFLSASLCFKCGKEGHFRRDCIKQAKAKQGITDLTSPGRYVEEKTRKSMFKNASRRRKRGKRLYKETVHTSEDQHQQKANWNTAQPQNLFGGELAIHAERTTETPAYTSCDQFSNSGWPQQIVNNHTGTSSLQAYQTTPVERDVQIYAYTLYSKFLSPQYPPQFVNHHVGTFLSPQYPQQIFNHYFGASSSQAHESMARRNL